MEYPKTHDEAEAMKRKASAESRKIGRMYKAYGKHAGEKCGDCKHFLRKQYANTYYKCKLFSLKGIDSDWRVNYEARGKFEK
jgi:hypothetical protein